MMMGVGMFCTHIKLFTQESTKILSKIILNIAVPSYMLSSLMTTYTRENLLDYLPKVILPFTSMVVCYTLGVIIAKLIRLPENRRGIFASTVSISNTLFIGLPINVALFGDASLPFVFIYFIANISLFWTLGVYGIKKGGHEKNPRFFNRETLKNLMTMPLFGLMFSFLLILLGVTIPKFVMDPLKSMGSIMTPLSMLYIGIILYGIDFKRLTFDRSMFLILGMKFIVSPLLMFWLCTTFAKPLLTKNVFMIQSAMPAMTITSVIAESGGTDHEYAAIVTTMTTLATLIYLPILLTLISSIA